MIKKKEREELILGVEGFNQGGRQEDWTDQARVGVGAAIAGIKGI